ncbi:ADL392Wp [Eremothecium gossypii ATCC 10895]|uniref:ADL392Wp n=1 Tax=Eremothecium gossypii (strain ATCC 10895 / CBS 109.51 / FGSC 9923 / NRRL Y-1056) TaxID=284811 RepID=Q75BG4_EREGS|nr:ADL392Wp [Eremothecium gossypii ATCC 10895]AAS51528.1 ADL392Wp [Eremothecium gossypii ATCC 10895]AEY95824.1 FADL392Wp [Eremothecium gossypii FDAG1]
MKFLNIGLLLAGATAAIVPDDVDKDTDSADSISLRELKLGQLNFLHTTDTHGWLGSHVSQPDYDATWGDYVSFAQRFRERVKDKDLILIDSGDKRTGNGLSDLTSPMGLKSSGIFNLQKLDLLTLGNHELYTEDVVRLEYYGTAMEPELSDKYVTSNVEFITEDGDVYPFGNKYRYFETPNQNLRVLAFAFMFDFPWAAKNVRLTPLAEEVKKDWFTQTVEKYPADKLDIIVVFGHLPVTRGENEELLQLHKRLRESYPDTIIQYFGGHTHVRDFVVLDEKATALQSGRYSETVGFLSIDDVAKEKPEFFRSYMDFNLRSFMHHSGYKNIEEFRTKDGEYVNAQIEELREKLGLNTVFGYVPEDYYLDAEPIESPNNIYNFLTNKILPTLRSDAYDETVSRFIMINTGSMRYDLYRGNFTADVEYIVTPYQNDWKYIEVPTKLGGILAAYMNSGKPIFTSIANELPRLSRRDSRCPVITDANLSRGYTTADDAGCTGDDTPHQSTPSYPVPNVVQSVEINEEAGEDGTAHLVFYSFMEKRIVVALNELNILQKVTTKTYSAADVKLYGGPNSRQLLRNYFKSLSY